MENEMAATPKRRLTARGRVLRRGRIFARLREGWAYDEIAQDEGVTAERIRQILPEAFETAGIRRFPPGRACLLASLALTDPGCALRGPGRVGSYFFRSFGHNALINLDSGKWNEIFGRILTLFGRGRALEGNVWKPFGSDSKISARVGRPPFGANLLICHIILAAAITHIT